MDLLQVLYPKKCLRCGLDSNYLCSSCLKKVGFARETCPGCRQYSFEGWRHSYCASRSPIERKISLWRHEGVVRSAIAAMKYRFVRGLGEELGGLVTTELRRRNIDTLEVVVVPIPLSVNRERWRGYNQAKLIAENLVGGYGLEAEYKLLLRTKHGRAQVGLHREERLRNIRGKFAVNQTTAHRLLAIGNTKVIIVDDVWTTGATVTEAAKTLKKAGFKNISALTVCG